MTVEQSVSVTRDQLNFKGSNRLPVTVSVQPQQLYVTTTYYDYYFYYNC